MNTMRPRADDPAMRRRLCRFDPADTKTPSAIAIAERG